MVRYRVSVKQSFGEVSVEGESEKDVIESLDALGRLSKVAGKKLAGIEVTAVGGKAKPREKVAEELQDWRGKFVEVIGTSIKFPAKSFDTFTAEEATGLLLYEARRPLAPAKIAEFLTLGWKKVPPASVRSYLTADKQKLSRYVTKVGDGYTLTAEGERWVETEVTPKLSESPTSEPAKLTKKKEKETRGITLDVFEGEMRHG